MKFDKHESDLYVLPESQLERNNLQSFVKTKGWGYSWAFSNVEGHDWHGKQFMDIPFMASSRHEIEEYFNVKQAEEE